MRVRVVPMQPHCFAFGGFEIQMIDALEAATDSGVDVQRLDPWSRDQNFQILHVWGLDISHLPAIRWAKRAGKRVVMTALLPHPTLASRWYYLRSMVSGDARLWQQVLQNVDRLVVVSSMQADTAATIFSFPRDRISIVPNIVGEEFFRARPRCVNDRSGGYVLCTGNVCRRKNQLTLVRACRKADVPLLLIGEVLTGEEGYGDAINRELAKGQYCQWIGGLPPKSVQLVEAYCRAAGYALVSHQETQPIGLLEAAALGKPLLIADRPYARQEFYSNALLVDRNSVDSIAWGVRRLISAPTSSNPTISVLLEGCSRKAVGRAYAEAYLAALR